MSSVRLFEGDCLEVMPKLVEEGVRVDLVLTDPPYGTTACKWDNLLSFEKIWANLKDMSTNITSYLFFSSEPFATNLRNTNLNDYKYDLYWCKNHSTGFVHAKNKPLKNIELINVFSKGTTVHKSQSINRMTYNPQGLIKIDKKVKSGDSKFGTINRKRPSHKSEYIQEYTNYPNMLINYDCVHKPVHPTQKPVELLEYLIKTYTNKGDTVLDFTMGSGSTGVACTNTNRNFIGIEQDHEYYTIAEQRIKEAQSQQRLDTTCSK